MTSTNNTPISKMTALLFPGKSKRLSTNRSLQDFTKNQLSKSAQKFLKGGDGDGDGDIIIPEVLEI